MKAISLFSGGLDSSLAAKIISSQGIEVTGVHYFMPFLKSDSPADLEPWVREKSNQLGIPIIIKDISLKFLEIVKQPRYGYGKNYNPCIDCKILMLNSAKDFMNEKKASFVITGEVVGQRPKSQHKDTLRLIEKQSGLEGFLLRPLSAKKLKPTIPEEKGWVNRNELFDFCGRNRRPQMELANQLGIIDYAWPGGGCLLTNDSFCTRVEDSFKHNSFTIDNVNLLKIGRHFRLSPEFKLIVGRNESENNRLAKFIRQGDLCFEPKELPGPCGLARGVYDENLKNICAQIISRYVKCDNNPVKITIKTIGLKEEIINAKPLGDSEVKKYLI